MHFRITLLFALLLCIVAGCNKSADHSKYIPKDATVVLAVNTSSLGKKIAWESIWGSKLLTEMQQKMDKKTDMMKDVEASGIKMMTTYYLYTKTDKRFGNGNRITAVLPLDNAAKWEAYLKKMIPDAVIKQQKERKEAMLSNDMYAGWTKDILIIMNTIYPPMDDVYNQLGEATADNYDSLIAKITEMRKPDANLMALEMDKAFTVSNDNAVTTKESYKKLQNAGHDISLWLNYESLTGDYMSAGMTGGLALSNTIMKDAALTMGFDFEAGSIEGAMQYYISDELKEAGKEFAKNNVDKDLINRLPAQNLNMIAGWNISPKGIRIMMEKMGVIGFMNTGLAETGLTADDIFTAFSGDMGMVLNDFKVNAVTVPANSLYEGQEAYTRNDPDINYTVALKIGKKESFDKLLQYAVKNKILSPESNGNYFVVGGKDTTKLFLDKSYMVFSNKTENASGFMQATFKAEAKNKKAASVAEHPFGMYVDVKTMLGSLDKGSFTSPKEKNMMEMTKNLLEDIVMTGGEYKGNTFNYEISVNFADKKENSLLQLINYAGKISEASKAEDIVATK